MRATSTIGLVRSAVRGAPRGHRRRSEALLAVLVLGWATAGCTRASQLRECGRVISTVRMIPWRGSRMGKPTGSGAPDAPVPKPSPRKLEATYKQLARELDQLSVSNPELKAQLGAYQSLLNRAAKGVSSLARARSTKDTEEIDKATQSLTQIKSSALATNAQINRVCQSRY